MNIKIYGTPTCRWCRAAKDLCQFYFIDYEYYDLTFMKPVDANNIVHWSGMKTVPIIYDSVTLIGGHDELKLLLEKGNKTQ